MHQVPDELSSLAESCALDCPSKDRACAASTCCGPSKQVKFLVAPGAAGQINPRLSVDSNALSTVSGMTMSPHTSVPLGDGDIINDA